LNKINKLDFLSLVPLFIQRGARGDFKQCGVVNRLIISAVHGKIPLSPPLIKGEAI
jgi:hypothetical protein